jgi:hypothetical protein
MRLSTGRERASERTLVAHTMTEQFILWVIVHFVTGAMAITGEDDDDDQPIADPSRVPPAMRDNLACNTAFDYPLFNL